MEPWTAECVISADQAGRLIESQFAQLAPVRLELLGVGFDNTAFRVNHAYVFRFPRRQVAVPLLETESRLLPALAARLPLPIPVPTFIGRPTTSFGWPFHGYPMLAGCTACAVALTDAQRTALAVPLACFLAALHSVPQAETVQQGAGPDPIGRLELRRYVPRARATLQKLAEDHVFPDIDPYLALLDRARATFVPRADTLVHGDLYARHLLVDAAHGLAGVIDWGDVHLGDPASDLMIAHSFLPPAAHDAFRRAYGYINDLTWQIAGLRALWHTVFVLAYGDAVGDEQLLREGRVALGYVVSA